MALFARIFNRSKPMTTEEKIRNLETLSAEQLLATINNAGEEEPVRNAAIRKLPFGPALAALATSEPPHAHETSARKRIGELLDSNVITIDELKKNINNHSQLVVLCGYSANAGLGLVMQTEDEVLLCDMASTSANTAIRQAAAEKVHDKDRLQALLKVAKNKDKSVYRLVKARLDSYKKAQALLEEQEEKARSLCHQAEQLLKRDIDEVFYARLQQIDAAWKQLPEGISDESTGRFDSIADQVNARIDAFETAKAEAARQEKAEREAKKELHQSLDNMQQLLARLFSAGPEDADTSKAAVRIQSEAHEEVSAQAKANGLNTEKEDHRFAQLKHNAEQLLEKITSHGASLQQLASRLKETGDESGKALKEAVNSITHHAQILKDEKAPESVAQARQAVSQWRSAIQARAEQAKAATQESLTLIRKGNWAVNNGQVRRARAIFSDLEDSLKKLDTIPNHVEAKYEELKHSMEKLGDWHHFAVTPKKEAMVEQMQGLVDSSLHPKELADRIKELQEKWRELSRGGQHNDESLWQQFKDASDKAFAPCKEWFEAQADQRQQNLEKRQQLVVQLREYLLAYDWDQANWPEVDKTLRIAKEAWQSYWPVPRKEGKTVQEEFDTIVQDIQGRLNEEFERNRLKKQHLATRAEALADEPDTASAIEKAKGLQSEWKAVGRCKARQDQALWQAFRGACDAVFDRRKQESEAERNERQQALSQAQSIIDELSQILRLNGEEFFARRPQADELSDRFKGLGELPRESYKAINKNFNDISQQLAQKAAKEKALQKQAVWLDILRAAHKLNTLEAETAKAGEPPASETVDRLLADSPEWPGFASQALLERASALKAGSPRVSSENEQAMRILCIHGEILAEIESPEADRQERMQYQVEKLQQGLGSLNKDSENSLEKTLEEWLNLPAIPPEKYAKFEQRLLTAWGLESARTETA